MTESERAPYAGNLLAGLLMGILLIAYAFVFLAFDTHMGLFQLSKQFASYDYRQYLGMSKRYLPQYLHVVFLFSLLLLSKYAFLSNQGKGKSDIVLSVILKYWIYVFLFHFPLLYFIASITKHNRMSDFQQAFLLAAVVIVSLLLGIPCLKLKPWFDGIQTRVLKRLKERAERSGTATYGESAPLPSKPSPLSITSSHSRFINVAKIVAASMVVIGHFSFPVFTTWDIPVAPGHGPRFSVPTFFIVSGYLTMLSLDRTKDGLATFLFKRYWALTYIVVPMLLIVPVMDYVGFIANEYLYRTHFHFGDKTTGGPETAFEFVFVFVSSILYLNEILIFKLLGLFSAHGGVTAFSNDAFWFVCYLLPFTALLAVMCKIQGPKKYAWLAVLAVLFGIPILISSPMFLAGAIAYKIHQRY